MKLFIRLLFCIFLITLISPAFFNIRPSTALAAETIPTSKYSTYRIELLQSTQDTEGKSKISVAWGAPSNIKEFRKDLGYSEDNLYWIVNLWDRTTGEHVALGSVGPLNTSYWEVFSYGERTWETTNVKWGNQYEIIITLRYAPTDKSYTDAKNNLGQKSLKFKMEKKAGDVGLKPVGCGVNISNADVEYQMDDGAQVIRAVHFRYTPSTLAECQKYEYVYIYRPGGGMISFGGERDGYLTTSEGTFVNKDAPFLGVYKFEVWSDLKENTSSGTEIVGKSSINVTGRNSNLIGTDESGKPIDYTNKTTIGQQSGTNNSGGGGECKSPSLLGPDPLGRAFQYAICTALEGLRDATDRILNYMFEMVLNYTLIEPIRPEAFQNNHKVIQTTDILYFWKVDRAHASLSAELNPDSRVESTRAKMGWAIDAWKTMKSFINIFLIFIIIFVAFANIFRFSIDKYAVKKALPGLVLGVMLANFSAIICCGILDIAEIFIIFVTGGNPAGIWMDAINGVWIAVLGAMTIGAVGAGITAAIVFTNPVGWGVAILAFVLIGCGVFLPLLLMFFTLALRNMIMITLFIISPVAFLCLGSPLTQGLFKKWWEEYIRWAFVPVLMFFLVWVAAKVVK